jgi:hypothetical protein
MIRSMVLEFILGLMDVNMKEAGVMDWEMEKENI